VALHVFGLTGGIGTGKTTVLGRFRARGVPAVAADVLARAVVEPGEPALGEIVDAFGADLLDTAGSLDRRRLGAIVFADPEARRRLEAIVHPRVKALARQRLAELGARGERLACYEAPLLVEVGLAEELRPLVVVKASEAVQIARAAARDGSSPDAIRARLSAQMPVAAKADLGDYVIDNDGPLGATIEQADRVLDSICQKLGIDPRAYPPPHEGVVLGSSPDPRGASLRQAHSGKTVKFT
jgi:dephospho-CoA kinase